jgi:hypothetical protein
VTRGLGVARLAALASSLAAAMAQAACLSIVARPEGAPLARLDGVDAFAVSYVHSVTRTPVEERYRVEGATIRQAEIRFVEHGPGLPTEADEGHAFRRRDGRFVVTMDRRFEAIAMRVHADQSPRLATAGRDVDLAAWGNRSIALVPAGDCAAH